MLWTNNDLVKYDDVLNTISEKTGYDKQIIHEILMVFEDVVNHNLIDGKGIKLHDYSKITHAVNKKGKQLTKFIVFLLKDRSTNDLFSQIESQIEELKKQ